ncbi:MAG: NUDIX hydrolase [Desulfarculales bacterium]|nr:NUDIX hydrolase [Desulfarculales bacterium]
MSINCPQCGRQIKIYRNPAPTVDTLISLKPGEVLLIERLNPPLGWALPGGFVEIGETTAQAACREALEETGLEISLTGILGVYSDPRRDLRRHTISVVYLAEAPGQTPCAGSDAGKWRSFPLDDPPENICFDHDLILRHYRQYLSGQRSLAQI